MVASLLAQLELEMTMINSFCMRLQKMAEVFLTMSRKQLDLHSIFNEQANELSMTVLISPTFTITMMPGAKIQEVYTVTPTLAKAKRG